MNASTCCAISALCVRTRLSIFAIRSSTAERSGDSATMAPTSGTWPRRWGSTGGSGGTSLNQGTDIAVAANSGGSMAEQAVQSSVDALKQRDLIAAHQIYAGDQRINEKRYAIEIDTITIIATQQPMARDVRLLAAVLEIITELERTLKLADEVIRFKVVVRAA